MSLSHTISRTISRTILQHSAVFCFVLALAFHAQGVAVAADKAVPLDISQAMARGESAMKQGDFETARAAFDRALETDSKYMPAHTARIRLAFKTKEWHKGFEWLKAANRAVKLKTDQRLLKALEIDMLSNARLRDGWYPRSKTLYVRFLRRDPKAVGDGRLTLAMARSAMAAHLRDKDPDYLIDAARYLRRTITNGGAEGGKASLLLATVNSRLQANIGNKGTQEIANKPAITRLDMVYLLSNDFDLTAYLGGALSSKKAKGETAQDGSTDYGHLALADGIRTVLRARFRALFADNGNFYPARHLTREELALILEDILIKKGDMPEMGRQFVGSASPYPDVGETRGSFNAIMSVVSRGLLAVGVKAEFRPFDPVTGAEAIIALRHLQSLAASE